MRGIFPELFNGVSKNIISQLKLKKLKLLGKSFPKIEWCVYKLSTAENVTN